MAKDERTIPDVYDTFFDRTEILLITHCHCKLLCCFRVSPKAAEPWTQR